MERSTHENPTMVNVSNGSPKRARTAQSELVLRAALLATAFAIAHLAGLREWVSALLEGSTSSLLERIGCSVYLFFYGSVLFIAPVLAIASLLLTMWDALSRRAKG